MAITYVGKGANRTGSAAQTPPLPAGVLEDDLLIIVHETRYNDTATAATGYTLITGTAPGTTVNDGKIHVHYKVAGASETDPTVPDAGNHNITFVVAFRGVDTSVPIDVQGTSSASATTNHTTPGVTTTVGDAMVVYVDGFGDDASATYGSLANASLESVTQANFVVSGSGSDGAASLVYGIKATAGASGSLTGTLTTGISRSSIVLALAPATTESTLLADDVSSTSEVTSPSVAQIHDLTPTSVSSVTSTQVVTLDQVHILNATDEESTSEVSAPALAETHILLANDVQTTSEVSAPDAGQGFVLLAEDIESTSQVSNPGLDGTPAVQDPIPFDGPAEVFKSIVLPVVSR